MEAIEFKLASDFYLSLDRAAREEVDPALAATTQLHPLRLS